MATIRAFRATRYARLIPEVVAPPYDVIDSEGRQALASQCAYNIVHLTLPEGEENRYQNAQKILQHWLNEGVLQTDAEPAIYRYTQQFIDPLTQTQRTRVGYFVLLHTEPYETGTVLPHEHTFPGVKEDRYRLLEATRTHLETIFGLFEPTPEFQSLLPELMWEPIARLQGDDLPEGNLHLLERLTNPVLVSRFERAFEPARVWIADGHHRYETALRFGLQYGSEGSPERFLPILLVPMDDLGLVILPTHRILSVEPYSDWEARVNEAFVVQSVPLAELPAQMASAQGKAVGFITAQGAWLIQPRGYTTIPDQPDALTRLDSWWLHHRLMPLMFHGEVEARYTRSLEEAVQAVQSGGAKASFLLNPPPLSALQQIAGAGGKMPHKSTYFHPKVLSGLITWRLGT